MYESMTAQVDGHFETGQPVEGSEVHQEVFGATSLNDGWSGVSIPTQPYLLQVI